MIKKNLYRYFGRNGMITSLVLLDNIEHLLMYRLIAEDGKMLTDGKQIVKSIDIFAEDLDKWTEIDNGQ